MLKLKFIYIIICLFILSGCVHTYEGGRKFNFENVKLIEKNITTKEDVIKLFGKPMEREVGTNNDEKWLYSSYVSKKDNFTKEENSNSIDSGVNQHALR